MVFVPLVGFHAPEEGEGRALSIAKIGPRHGKPLACTDHSCTGARNKNNTGKRNWADQNGR